MTLRDYIELYLGYLCQRRDGGMCDYGNAKRVLCAFTDWLHNERGIDPTHLIDDAMAKREGWGRR